LTEPITLFHIALQAEFTSVKAHVKEVGKVRFNCDGT
jgi:hypothetical protein